MAKLIAICEGTVASTPGRTELVGHGSRPLILHGRSLGNAIAQKHHITMTMPTSNLQFAGEVGAVAVHGE